MENLLLCNYNWLKGPANEETLLLKYSYPKHFLECANEKAFGEETQCFFHKNVSSFAEALGTFSNNNGEGDERVPNLHIWQN